MAIIRNTKHFTC